MVIWFSLLSYALLSAQGRVYLVLGSDTAIWDGMDTGRFHCTYSLALYTDPMQNGSKVMEQSFRNQLVDSYGQTIKFTWWMMGGNIFRYATNKNVPLPNTMTIYLMRKYQGEAIKKFGDELTVHYHTFSWTDYDQDGIFWWNQAHGFAECKQDFDETLAMYLLEEETFPVSFRSGWHYMDNFWQLYLDTLLPYSMDDDWPSVRMVTAEPIDNVYDWSKSSKEFVPFHPSPENYQLPGTCRGWNLRSTHFGSVDSTMMNSIFSKANAGVDQVACLWGHLPETDFLDNIKKIDRLAHAAASKYPGVKFRYCTAVEAMQRWRGTTDETPPNATVLEQRVGSNIAFVITSNETIFQVQPFVAVKDVYERYSRVLTTRTGANEWTTADPIPAATLAKVGVAVTDTAGNLRTTIIRHLPDDLYIDNRDSSYAELAGSWSTSSNNAWGTDARTATLAQGDSAKVQWKPMITQSGRYNIFLQVPTVQNPAGKTTVRVLNKGQVVQTAYFEKPLTAGDWVYVATVQLDAGGSSIVEMVVNGEGQPGKIVAADVLKLSALVRERQIAVGNNSVDFGEVSEADTARYHLTIQNLGTSSLTVTSVRAQSTAVFSLAVLPMVVPPMQSVDLTLGFCSQNKGLLSDTLFIASDDPLQPNLGIQVTGRAVSYFAVVDNEESTNYKEYGTWYFSNAQAYGASSRYAWITDGPGSYARYSTTLKKSGVYDIQMIVPKTANASTKARYVLSAACVPFDSALIDQNAGSGSWVTVLTKSLSRSVPIDVTISDATAVPVSGVVLRADALKFSLRQEATGVEKKISGDVPDAYELQQNHPNPFSPSTFIEFGIPKPGYVLLRVFDMLGREVAVLFEGMAEAGRNVVTFQPRDLSSGAYLVRLEAGGFVQTRKVLLLK